ncbi:hypothetical protein NWE59_00520 [Mycoplasmopsis felis]|nr:hypothetical protein NWE59_00520 [Mycoplasmopsis felis]
MNENPNIAKKIVELASLAKKED